MTAVVTTPCRGCKDLACVRVCPHDAFRDAGDFVVVHPLDCADCQACIAECPVNAIFYHQDLEPQDRHWIEFNAALAEQNRVAVFPPSGAETVERSSLLRRLLGSFGWRGGSD